MIPGQGLEVVKTTAEMALGTRYFDEVTGKVYYYDNPDRLQTVGKKHHPVLWSGGQICNNEKDVGQFDKIEERYFCDDIFWLVRKDLFKKTGGYDTTFFLQAEDWDWQARANSLDYKIY